jgi:hypothetical protein
LPENAVPLALLFFNLGVEAGQLSFIALMVGVAAIALARWFSPSLRVGLRRATAYGIGGLAAFWTIERVASFWR